MTPVLTTFSKPRTDRPTATAAELIRDAAARLTATGSETGRLDAEVLLRHLIGIDRTKLFARLREQIEPAMAEAFAGLVERRLRGEPIAYITGEREFMGLNFVVGPGVLIPRPETELMVEWAIDWLGKRDRATIVDVGTGSGAIVLSLAARLKPDRADRFVGIERWPDALAYAIDNRERLGLVDRVQFVLGHGMEAVDCPVDLVLANLPYLTPEQVSANPDLAAEPRNALISGADGLDAIRGMIADLPRVLSPDSAVMLEIDPSQATSVAADLGGQLPGAHVTIVRDLAQYPRFVVAETASSRHA